VKTDALDLMAALVVDDDGHRWGEVALDFQWDDARAVLDTSGSPYHFLTRPRGASKTTDLAGVAVAAMLTQLPDASRLYGLAADRDQGRLLVDSAAEFSRRTPELRGALEVSAFTVALPRTGSTLEVIAADAASAYGLHSPAKPKGAWLLGGQLIRFSHSAVRVSTRREYESEAACHRTVGYAPARATRYAVSELSNLPAASRRSRGFKSHHLHVTGLEPKSLNYKRSLVPTHDAPSRG